MYIKPTQILTTQLSEAPKDKSLYPLVAKQVDDRETRTDRTEVEGQGGVKDVNKLKVTRVSAFLSLTNK